MPKKKRPHVLAGNTYKLPTPCGNLFLRINKDKGDIIEVMAQMGKAGNCSNAWLEGLCCVWSEAFKFDGITKEEKIDMIEQIRHIRCSQSHKNYKSCLDQMANVIIEELEAK